MSEIKKPNLKFVGLHAHSVVGSPFDGFGYPKDHMEYAHSNGCDALALTDHGNMNGLAYQVLHAKKMESDGRKFKPIYGIEAYFIDSIEDWRREKDKIEAEKAAAKKAASKDTAINATVVEDELEIRKMWKSVINKRCHFLLLAADQEGLYNIFKMVSMSYDPSNFYRFPRIDYKMLEEYNKGVIASNACIGGLFGRHLWETKDNGGLSEAYKKIQETSRRMLDIFKDRFYGEIQWNDIKEQHELNQLTIEAANEFGFKLISTADSHYPTPDAWKDREIYKRLGFMSKNAKNKPDWLSDDLPCSINELGYELYPKNGDQMWDAYKKYSKSQGFSYDDDLVRQSIEETYEIAHKRIDDFYPDNEIRLPDYVVPPNKTEDQALIETSIAGLKRLNKDKDQEYIDRLKYELQVIMDRGFSKYFLTTKAITDYGHETQLVGCGRGSSAGSLISYCLNITSIDPIRWGLQFERFMRKMTEDEYIGVSETLNGGKYQKQGDLVEIQDTDGNKLYISPKLILDIKRGDATMKVKAENLREGDEII